MLRLNKMTDYAVALLARMAQDPGGRFSTSALAQGTGIGEPTIAKLLKDLAKSGIVASFRGAQGGYQLSCPGEEVTLRQVIEALDGPIALTDCIGGQEHQCAASARCCARGAWDRVNDAIIAALDGVTLDQMMTPQKETLYDIAKTA